MEEHVLKRHSESKWLLFKDRTFTKLKKKKKKKHVCLKKKIRSEFGISLNAIALGHKPFFILFFSICQGNPAQCCIFLRDMITDRKVQYITSNYVKLHKSFKFIRKKSQPIQVARH